MKLRKQDAGNTMFKKKKSVDVVQCYSSLFVKSWEKLVFNKYCCDIDQNIVSNIYSKLLTNLIVTQSIDI